jgi:hypothetical protein
VLVCLSRVCLVCVCVRVSLCECVAKLGPEELGPGEPHISLRTTAALGAAGVGMSVSCLSRVCVCVRVSLCECVAKPAQRGRYPALNIAKYIVLLIF